MIPWLYDLVGLASLGLLAWACVEIDAYQPLLYRGGLGIVAVATVLVIAAILRPGTHLVPGLLAWGPLRWIGLRSYGIYLWHWPVFMLTRPQLDLPLGGVPLFVLRFALTLVLAELSYRCVEKPLRAGALGRARQAFGQARGAHRLALALRWGSAFLGLAILSAFLGRAVVNSQPSTPSWYVGTESVRTVLSSPTVKPGELNEALTPTMTASPIMVDEPVSSTPTSLSTEPASMIPPSQAETPAATHTAQVRYTIVPATLVASVDFGSTAPSAASSEEPKPTPYSSWDDYGSPRPSATPDGAAAPTVVPSPVDSGSSLSATPSASAPLSTTWPLDTPSATPTAAQHDALEILTPLPNEVQDAAQVVAIGDSVMVSAADELTDIVDGLAIDAAIGRQMREVIEVLQEILDAGKMGDIVVIQVGNNGYLSAKKFDEMMLLLEDVPSVLILNCRVPRQWESTVNTVLAEGVQRYANATLIDWYAASADHPEFFWNDGMHLRPDGAKVYAELIVEQIEVLSQ